MQFGFAERALNRAKLLRRNPCCQNVVAVLRETREDLGELLRTLPRPEDHLRHAHAQRSMMVHISEAEVLERKMLQPLHSLIGRELTALHLVKQFFDGFGIHGAVVSSE